jgi:hypothetical protein
LVLLSIISSGCAVSGVIVDLARYETSLKNIKVENGSALKIYHGGSFRLIPLNQLASIDIRPSETIVFENELYYGADIVLKGGKQISPSENDLTSRAKSFVGVQSSIIGKNGRENVKIGLEKVSRITILLNK